jgi:hypothetical protein
MTTKPMTKPTTKPVKRIGRPPKTPTTKRVSLGLKVSEEIKRLIDSLAQASGRTQSQEAEYLIERALQYDRTMASMRTTLEKIEHDSIEAALYRKGWRPTRYLHTDKKMWAEPGFPGIERGGFMPEDEGREAEADQKKAHKA